MKLPFLFIGLLVVVSGCTGNVLTGQSSSEEPLLNPQEEYGVGRVRIAQPINSIPVFTIYCNDSPVVLVYPEYTINVSLKDVCEAFRK